MCDRSRKRSDQADVFACAALDATAGHHIDHARLAKAMDDPDLIQNNEWKI
jgi:hypothetical protein